MAVSCSEKSFKSNKSLGRIQDWSTSVSYLAMAMPELLSMVF